MLMLGTAMGAVYAPFRDSLNVDKGTEKDTDLITMAAQVSPASVRQMQPVSAARA